MIQEEKFEFVTVDNAPDYEICKAGLLRSKTRYITDKNNVTRCVKGRYMSIQETGYVNVTVKDEYDISSSIALYIPSVVMKTFNKTECKSSDIIILDDTLPVTKRFALDNLIRKDVLFVEAEHTPIKGSTIYKIVHHILNHADMYDEDTIIKADRINSKYLMEDGESKPINKNNYYYINFKFDGNVFIRKDQEKSDISQEKERVKRLSQRVYESSNTISIPPTIKKIEKVEEKVDVEKEELKEDVEVLSNNVETLLGQKVTKLLPYKKVKVGQLFIKLEILSLSEVRFYLVEEDEATIFFEGDPNLDYIVRKTKGEVIHLCS